MQIRLSGLARIDPTHGRRAALEVEMDGTCWEIDEAGEPPATQFAGLLKRHDPDVILSEWGDSTILPLLRQQAERLRSSLPLNRDESRPCSNPAAAATRVMEGFFSSQLHHTLWPHPRGQAELVHFGEVRLRRPLGTGPPHKASDSIRSADDDGTGIPTCRWNSPIATAFSFRAESGTGRSQAPDELLLADRGGLVFVPKLGFTPNVAELDFVSQFPQHHGAIQYFTRNRELRVLPDAPRISELGYRIARNEEDHEPRGRTAYRQAM